LIAALENSDAMTRLIQYDITGGIYNGWTSSEPDHNEIRIRHYKSIFGHHDLTPSVKKVTD
jgi:hypothetical protein